MAASSSSREHALVGLIGRTVQELVAAAAGTGRAAISSSLEAVAAATGRDGVGIVDGEAGAHQAIHVIYLAVGDIARAHLVHKHTDAVQLEGDVALLGLVKGHAVLHARAATA